MANNHKIHDCSMMIIMEMWLHPLIPDSAVQLTGRFTHRFNRNKSSGKSRGGGLCIHVLMDWCTSNRVIHTQCSPDLEVLTVQCRPFYMPRELTTVIIAAVYIPTVSNVNIGLSQLYASINQQMQAHPEGAFIVAGDLNQACRRTSVSLHISATGPYTVFRCSQITCCLVSLMHRDMEVLQFRKCSAKRTGGLMTR